MRINDFEWDEGNALHLQLGHGIVPEEAEEVFELKPKGIARPITGWDMRRAEIQYYKKHRR